MTGSTIQTEDLGRVFESGRTQVQAVSGVNLTASPGELLVLRGPSGSGKTSLLNLLGGLDRPTSGRVLVDGADLNTISEEDLVEWRRSTVGYVFQSFELIAILSAVENIEVPLRLAAVDPDIRERRVAELLALVDLTEHGDQRPDELSGGQQQRVAVARALACQPQVLLADEPTAQLDSSAGRNVMKLIRDLVHAMNVTAVVTTHDPIVTDMADRVLELRDGQIHDGSPRSS